MHVCCARPPVELLLNYSYGPIASFRRRGAPDSLSCRFDGICLNSLFKFAHNQCTKHMLCLISFMILTFSQFKSDPPWGGHFSGSLGGRVGGHLPGVTWGSLLCRGVRPDLTASSLWILRHPFALLTKLPISLSELPKSATALANATGLPSHLSMVHADAPVTIAAADAGHG